MARRYFNFNYEADITPLEVEYNGDEIKSVKITLDNEETEFSSIEEFAEFYAVARGVQPSQLKNWHLAQNDDTFSYTLIAATAGADIEEAPKYDRETVIKDVKDVFDSAFKEHAPVSDPIANAFFARLFGVKDLQELNDLIIPDIATDLIMEGEVIYITQYNPLTGEDIDAIVVDTAYNEDNLLDDNDEDNEYEAEFDYEGSLDRLRDHIGYVLNDSIKDLYKIAENENYSDESLNNINTLPWQIAYIIRLMQLKDLTVGEALNSLDIKLTDLQENNDVKLLATKLASRKTLIATITVDPDDIKVDYKRQDITSSTLLIDKKYYQFIKVE